VTRVGRIEERIRELGRVVVAFSGGVDSSLVACLSARALGERALAVTAVSPALATGELDGARAVAYAVGIAHETITTDELAREGYRRNGDDRCYHCKSELYERLAALATDRGYRALLSGANADDLRDWRPGLRAAEEHGVVHPLVELGVGKEEVRALSRQLAVPSADKPASPCLASRIPHGTAVDPVALAAIDRAELGVKALGFGALRVRHHGTHARVEIGAAELARAQEAERDVLAAVLAAGYTTAELSPEPLRSGSLTAAFTRRLDVSGRC
jgi:uncharacterized protein